MAHVVIVLYLCIFRLTPQQVRVIDGCLGRTPKKFYEKVYKIESFWSANIYDIPWDSAVLDD